MSDPDQLQRVALALAAAIESGARGEKVKLPVIQPGDAAGLTTMMYAQLDEAIARRDAQVGERMACHLGCNGCCTSPILVTEGEGVAIAEWLRQPEHADVRARFEAAYPAWRDRIGDLVGQGETSDADEHRTWMLGVLRRSAMCAFNHEGACTIYPVRPAICRKTHALYTNANCTNEDTPAQYYNHPETEQVYDDQRPMRFALHKALRPAHRLDLVCSTVKRLLGGSAAGRNDPCPCGSGKKFKKCCGA